MSLVAAIVNSAGYNNLDFPFGTMFGTSSRFGVAAVSASVGALAGGCAAWKRKMDDSRQGSGLQALIPTAHASSHDATDSIQPHFTKAYLHASSVTNNSIPHHNAYSNELPSDAAFGSSAEPGKWDKNWDKRDPKYIQSTRPAHKRNEETKEQSEVRAPTASRRIILIRHGQYNLSGKTDAERALTDLGHKQAKATATRLKYLLADSPPSVVVHSTMMRAKQTFSSFHDEFSEAETSSCDLLREGACYPPDPPSKNWHPEYHVSRPCDCIRMVRQ